LYHKTVLENGIWVVTDTMSEVRSFALGILVGAGPQNEHPGQTGLAHLTEHALFLGTSSRDATQVAHFMDMAGGSMGAFTTRDYTCFFATVLDDYRTYALDLLGDILLNSTFPRASVERERQAILREIDTSRDTPEERVSNLLKSSVWPDHPLGRPVLGVPETVSRLTREDVIYFVHEHYVPDRLIIAAAGRVDHDDFVAQVRDAFWRLLGKGRRAAPRPPQWQAGVTLVPAPVSQSYFCLAVRGYPYAHPDRYPLHVLNNILGGGISARLFRRIREERGLAYNIGSEYHAYRDGGLLVVDGSTAPEHLLTVLRLTLVELWRFAAPGEPVDDEELWKAKMHLRGQHLLGDESSSTRMSRLATQEYYFGRHIPSREILRHIDGVDGRGLQRLADDLLRDALGQVAVALVGPRCPRHYSRQAIEALLREFAGIPLGPREAVECVQASGD
jgi:predicted Zn-dependent peptidase